MSEDDYHRLQKPYLDPTAENDQRYLHLQLKRRFEHTAEAQQAHEPGHHQSRGDRSVNGVRNVLYSPLCASWVDEVQVFEQNTQEDKEGKDMSLFISDATPQGRGLLDLIGHNELTVQVKSSDRNVHQFAVNHMKKESQRKQWREKGMIVLNGQLPPERIAVDLGIQMLNLTGNIFDSQATLDFVSVMDPPLQAYMTDTDLLKELMEVRYLIIRKLNEHITSGEFTGNKSQDVDYLMREFAEVGKVLRDDPPFEVV